MHQGRTRRNFLYGAGFVAAGGGAVVAGVAASGQRAGSPSWRIGAVSAVRAGAVQVDGTAQWLPMEGFPDSWEALVGDQVAIAASATGHGDSANPMIHWVNAVAAPDELRPGLRLNGGAGPQVVAATVLDPGLAAQRERGVRASATLRVAIGDRAAADASHRILSIQPA